MAEPSSAATRLRRHPERGRYDRATVDAILDEALICHLGFVAGGRPFVIPTIHARAGDLLYIHGSPASRMLNALKEGIDCCVTATLLDGLVLARSAFNHSMNFRSAVVLGRAEEVTDPQEKSEAFAAVVNHVAAGRWEECRWPTEREARATTILRLPIEEYSAKLRSGPPKDDSDDLQTRFWAGVLPMRLASGEPQPAPDLDAGTAVPGNISDYRRP